MALSSDLISQLVKVNKEPKKATESTSYGTTVLYEGRMYVKLDGSDILTPINTTTTSVNDGDRVTVLIKDHTATVTGNMSDPSASSDTVTRQNYKISEFEGIIAYKVTTDNLEAINAYIDTLRVELARIDKLDAVKAEIDELEAYLINAEHLTATDMKVVSAQIESLEATFGKFTDVSTENLEAINAEIAKLKAYTAEFTYVSAEVLEAMRAQIKNLDVENLDAKYANIDFANIGEAAFKKIFSDSGLIRDLVVGDSTITGELVGVTIKGDLIEGNTVKADKLVVKGSDGIYYKLNFEAGSFKDGEAVPTDSLHGSIITAKSVTAEKVSVEDLVAFDATIGGFNITDHSIYSGVKSSVDNTTSGIYLDKEGQAAFGDSKNFFRCYKAKDGTYKLEISADSIRFSSTDKTIAETIDNIQIGGRNLLQNSNAFSGDNVVVNQAAMVDGTYAGLNVCSYDSASVSSGMSDVLQFEGIYVENLGVEYTLSFYAKGAGILYAYFQGETGCVECSTATPSSGSVSHETDGQTKWYLTNAWTRHWVTWTLAETGDVTIAKDILFRLTHGSKVGICGVKLEKGNKATDWTPAPEDVDGAISDVNSDVQETNAIATDASSRVTLTESEIKQLADMIATLITGENGSSLMTQTETGWTFDISQIINKLDTTATGVDTLSADVNSVNGSIDTLKQAVNDLGILTDYVIITTYNGQPCIELGESDNNFKLRITNTEIQFADGTTIPAYVSNKKLMIEQAEVKDELKFGGFVWKNRINGNMGLLWSGGENLLVNTHKFMAGSPFTLSGADADSYTCDFGGEAIYTPVPLTPGTTLTLQACSDAIWSMYHGESITQTKQTRVGMWIYWCSTLTMASETSNAYVIPEFCAADDITTGRYTWPIIVPEATDGVTEWYAKIRLNAYSDGNTVVTHKFWNIKLENGPHADVWSPHVDDVSIW